LILQFQLEENVIEYKIVKKYCTFKPALN
jgi:hypothetical protein